MHLQGRKQGRRVEPRIGASSTKNNGVGGDTRKTAALGGESEGATKEVPTKEHQGDPKVNVAVEAKGQRTGTEGQVSEGWP